MSEVRRIAKRMAMLHSQALTPALRTVASRLAQIVAIVGRAMARLSGRRRRSLRDRVAGLDELRRRYAFGALDRRAYEAAMRRLAPHRPLRRLAATLARRRD